MSGIHRITSNGMMRTYKTNLMRSTNRLSEAMVRVETHRQFNATAEAPATANQVWQRRRALWRNEDQTNNNAYVTSKFQTAFSSLKSVVDVDGEDKVNLSGLREAIRGLNDADAGGRKALGQSALAKAESIVSVLNTTYGETFVFAGADGLNTPFTENEDGELLYRGLNVNNTALVFDENGVGRVLAEADKKTLEDFPLLDSDGEPVTELVQRQIDRTDPAYTITQDAYSNDTVEIDSKTYVVDAEGNLFTYTPYVDQDGNDQILMDPDDNTKPLLEKAMDTDHPVPVCDEEAFASYEAHFNPEEAQKLLDLSEEATYVDIGIGLKEQDGELVTSSAYNSALCGLNFVGFGVDEDGNNRNLVSIMKELGTIMNNCDAVTGSFAEEGGGYERCEELLDCLQAALKDTSEAHVDLSAKSEYLKANASQLKTTADTLEEERAMMEDIDPADAITEMLYAQYFYNAALKIGNDILSQTLLDYMR